MNEPDQHIVQRAIDGDRSAFRQLVLEHSEHVFRLAWRLTSDEALAEDVVQETFIKAWTRLSTFDQRARFGTWLHRIAVNAALDALRRCGSRGRYEKAVDDMPEGVAPGQQCPAEQEEFRRNAARALERLSDVERAAFVLRHYEGRSIAEIGDALDLGASASKQAVFRAVRKMRDALSPLAPAADASR